MYSTLVDAATLADHLGDPDWLLLDCRFSLADTGYGARVYGEGHLPGAHYLDLDQDLSSPITPDSGRHPLPQSEKLAATLVARGLNRRSQVVVYDDCGGMMAARCWWLLRWLGHAAVALLDGGIQAWPGALETAIPVATPGDFSARLRPAMNLDVAAVLANLAQPAFTLVDARSGERFRGEQEPIDPVAGHVPGALNRPLGDNLRDGRFKPAAELRDEWQRRLAGVVPGQVVHMCGSGVTACHNQLAMEIAGLTGSRLYAGSWSEWIRDPARPVAQG